MWSRLRRCVHRAKWFVIDIVDALRHPPTPTNSIIVGQHTELEMATTRCGRTKGTIDKVVSQWHLAWHKYCRLAHELRFAGRIERIRTILSVCDKAIFQFLPDYYRNQWMGEKSLFASFFSWPALNSADRMIFTYMYVTFWTLLLLVCLGFVRHNNRYY